jgi:flagellar assembly factor FliW
LATCAVLLTAPPGSRVVRFASGLVGMAGLRHFRLVDEGNAPWYRLRCLDAPVAFTVVNPAAVKPDYAPELPPEALAAIGTSRPDDVVLLAVAVVGPQGPECINLLAPLCFNSETLAGVQAVLDPDVYPLRYPVAP